MSWRESEEGQGSSAERLAQLEKVAGERGIVIVITGECPSGNCYLSSSEVSHVLFCLQLVPALTCTHQSRHTLSLPGGTGAKGVAHENTEA